MSQFLFKNIKKISALLLLPIIAAVFFYFNESVQGDNSNSTVKSEQIIEQNNIDIEGIAKNIAISSRIYLENFAIKELQEKIKLDFDNEYVKAIVINDSYLNKDILISYKDDKGVVVFSKKLPFHIDKNFSLYTHDIIVEKDYDITKIGQVTLYYDFASKFDHKSLTVEEKEYLETKKEIKVCTDPLWMPFEKIENEKHVGIAADYMEIFSKNLKIPFKLVVTKTWDESLKKIKEKECDILSLASKTKQREKYLEFTKPYISTPIVIATRTGITFIDSIEQVKSKRLGVVKGYSLHEVLKKQYPDINLVEVDSIGDGLKLVEENKIFGYLDNSIVINHEIQNNFLDTLSISGKLKNNIYLGTAVREDEKILKEILNKVIEKFDDNLKNKIRSKWVKVNYSIKTNYTLLWQVSFVLLLIIAGTVYWNRRLSLVNKQLHIQSKKAQEATKIKSEFLANMSHEIRTPMNGIIGMCNLALQSNLDDKSRKYIQRIDESANTLLHIINDILDFSKIEAGKLDIEQTDFKLKDVIDSSIDIVALKAKEKKLHIDVTSNIKDNEVFYGDPLRLYQVLTNLLSNAVKFTNDGKIDLMVNHTKNRCFFEVKDTGVGMGTNEIKKLFNPFTQADGSTTREFGGTGLGLVITKQFVNLMGGEISVVSQKDKGSSFSFEIELIKKNLQKDDNKNILAKKSIDTVAIMFENSNILLVEDNKINQEIVVGLLENSKIIIDIANNGKEAVEIFNNNPNKYDLILMDIQMPVMGGIEASQLIKRINPKTPIVALSANAMPNDILETKKAGMDYHIIKPININHLYTILKKYLKVYINNTNLQKNNKPKETNNKVLDIQRGLILLGNNKKLYLNIVKDFYDKYLTIDIEKIEAKHIKMQLHTLKGLCGNIGALKLQYFIQEYEKSDDSKLLHEISQQLKLLLSELAAYIQIQNSETQTTKTKITKEELESRFKKLFEAIKTRRPNKYKNMIDELENCQLDKEDEEFFTKLKQEIKYYKFDKALEIIDARENKKI
ncbi:MAG: transporter substrate-binding domain-containing protein [Campylobacterota bacterium]|nr:transporter substrate-binding domain-containing protein [Campylobacterota bacterium]